MESLLNDLYRKKSREVLPSQAPRVMKLTHKLKWKQIILM